MVPLRKDPIDQNTRGSLLDVAVVAHALLQLAVANAYRMTLSEQVVEDVVAVGVARASHDGG